MLSVNILPIKTLCYTVYVQYVTQHVPFYTPLVSALWLLCSSWHALEPPNDYGCGLEPLPPTLLTLTQPGQELPECMRTSNLNDEGTYI